jgi:D-threo-aldose 1-dehydrogenase
LLHECTAVDLENPGLLEFLQSLIEQGTIRKFGVATGVEETLRITRSQPVFTSVVQIPNSVWQANIRQIAPKPDRLTITHSCLGGRFHELCARLSSDSPLAREWESMTNINPRDVAALAQLFLADALRSNPDGMVLFSSSKPNNIKSNVRIVEETVIHPSQIDAFNILAKKIGHL